MQWYVRVLPLTAANCGTQGRSESGSRPVSRGSVGSVRGIKAAEVRTRCGRTGDSERSWVNGCWIAGAGGSRRINHARFVVRRGVCCCARGHPCSHIGKLGTLLLRETVASVFQQHSSWRVQIARRAWFGFDNCCGCAGCGNGVLRSVCSRCDALLPFVSKGTQEYLMLMPAF